MIFEKKKIVLGVAHEYLSFPQFGPKNRIFRGFNNFFSELLDSN